MTSQDIRASDELFKSERGWLKEIAYQLALLNENKPQEAVKEVELCYCGKTKGHVGRHARL